MVLLGAAEAPTLPPDAEASVTCAALCSVELRQRQEMIMRNQMAMAPQILAQGQQRLQGVPAQFEPRFMERLVLFFPLVQQLNFCQLQWCK